MLELGISEGVSLAMFLWYLPHEMNCDQQEVHLEVHAGTTV